MNVNWKKTIFQIGTIGLASGLILSNIVTPASACYLCKVRDRVRKSVRTETNRGLTTIGEAAGGGKFYIKNRCRKFLNVSVEYIPLGGSRFSTRNYYFSPGEHAYIGRSNNRYIYITAKSIDGIKSWRKFRVDTGASIRNFTQSLSC